MSTYNFFQLFRYSFLIAGIFYGATKKRTLQAIESGRREEKEKLKLEREKKLAEEKELASQRDIAQIIEIFTGKKTGTAVPKETSQEGEGVESFNISEGRQSREIQDLYFNPQQSNSEQNSDIYKEYDDFSRVIDLREHHEYNNLKDKGETSEMWEEPVVKDD